MRPLLKISPSTLEEYRVCATGMYRKTLQNFLERLDAPWVQNDAQARGEAYHLILEHGGLRYMEVSKSGEYQYRVPDKSGKKDWIFSEAQAAPAIYTHDTNPNKKHEVWGKLQLDLDDFSVVINLKMDAVDNEAKVIWDYKTTGKPPEKEAYANSVQWPLYMMANPDIGMFRYRIFQLMEDGCDQTDYLFEKSLDMETYAMQWLEHLADFIQKNDLHSKFSPNFPEQ